MARKKRKKSSIIQRLVKQRRAQGGPVFQSEFTPEDVDRFRDSRPDAIASLWAEKMARRDRGNELAEIAKVHPLFRAGPKTRVFDEIFKGTPSFMPGPAPRFPRRSPQATLAGHPLIKPKPPSAPVPAGPLPDHPLFQKRPSLAPSIVDRFNLGKGRPRTSFPTTRPGKKVSGVDKTGAFLGATLGDTPLARLSRKVEDDKSLGAQIAKGVATGGTKTAADFLKNMFLEDRAKIREASETGKEEFKEKFGREPKWYEVPDKVTELAIEKAPEQIMDMSGGIVAGPIRKAGKKVAQEALESIGKRTAKKADAALDDIGEAAVKKFETADIDTYVKDLVEKQKGAKKLEDPGIKQKATDFYRDVKTKMVDFAAPIEDTLRLAEKKGGYKVLPEKHITNQIDRVLRAPTIAGSFVKKNGLEDVIKKVDNLETFDQYLIARHTQDVSAKGIKTGRDLAKDAELVNALSPKYEEAAKSVSEYSQKLLDYSVESGLIDQGLATKLKQQYPNYVPLKRVFDITERMDVGAGKAIASRARQNVVQKLQGSEREIESPVKSLMEKTVDAVRQGEQNKAARMLADYRNLPDNPFQITELKAGEKAAHSFAYLDQGVARKFEAPKEIVEAAKALDVQQLNVLGRIFAAPVRLAKVGITGINLPFILSNVARDQATAIINSKAALKTSVANPKVFVSSLLEAVGHGKVYKEMAEEGALGTSFDLMRNQAAPTIERIRAGKDIKSKIKYTIKHPGELYRAVEDTIARSEEFTRISQFQGTRQAMAEKGMNPQRATIEASRAARENTINFARRGEYGKVLNSAFLYLNAGIQGTRTFVRSLSQRPAQTAVKVALVGFTPVATATAWNLSDEKRKEAYDDIAEYEKENNIIIVPPNPTQDDRGRWNIIKIPLSQEINSLTNVVRKGLEQAHGLDPVSVMDVVRGLTGTVSPVELSGSSILSTLTPQAIKPTLEGQANYNLFTQRPIVPEYMEELSPELQAYPFTSGTARKIGEVTGKSPIKTESFVKSTLGGVGSQALNLSDQLLAAAGVIPKDQIGGQDVREAIGARFMKARGGEVERREAQDVEQAVRKESDEDFMLRQEAKKIHEEFKQLGSDEANRRLGELSRENRALYEKVKNEAVNERSDLSPAERKMFGLGINNGARAEFIHEQIQKLKTAEERNAYIEMLEGKRIVTKRVKKQLRKLARNQ